MFSGRNSSIVVALVVLALPGLLFFALRVETNTQDVHTWLPGGTTARADYDQFIDLFGYDDDLIVSWEGCTTDDPRLEQMKNLLWQHTSHVVDESGSCFCDVASGNDVLGKLTSEGSNLTDRQARKRMEGTFFGPDGQTTGLVARLSSNGRRNRKACIGKIYETTELVAGLEADDLRIGGSSYISVQIHNATNQALAYSLPAALLAILVTFFALKSIRLTTITLSVASVSALVGVAFVCLCGYKINGLLVLMPVIVMVLTLSGGVHLAGYYRQSLKEDPFSDAVAKMFRLGWRPCVLAMITTSIGILMLCTSHIEAVRHFGFFTATGLLLALVLQLALYPALLTLWPLSGKERQKIATAAPTIIECRCQDEIIRRPWLANVGVAIALLMIPVLLYGATRLKTTLGPENMFHAASDVHRNHGWLEENLTPIQCVELVATFDNETLPRMSSQVDRLQQIQSKLLTLPEVKTAFSFGSLCEKIPQGTGFRDASRRSFINNRIKLEKPNLVSQRLLATRNGHTSWRIRLGLEIEDETQYASLTTAIETMANHVCLRNESHADFLVTGIWPLSATGRQQLFSDLATSFILAFLMITPLIMLILRGASTGLVAMITNVFPALLFFGAMGWAGLSVDIGTILTASVGLGIAVDDTLHFLETYMRERKNAGDRTDAVWKTVMHCGRPMLHTTLICGAGLAVFAASQFVPARQFAIAIVVLLGLALLSDMLLLPALMLGPFGKLFDRTNADESSSAENVMDSGNEEIILPITQPASQAKPDRKAA